MNLKPKTAQALLGVALIALINIPAGSLGYFVKLLSYGGSVGSQLVAIVLGIATIVIFILCVYANLYLGKEFLSLDCYNKDKKEVPSKANDGASSTVKNTKELGDDPGELIGAVCGAIIFILTMCLLINFC